MVTPCAIFTHPACLKHEMGNHHPESPARLIAITAALKYAPFAEHLKWFEAPPATKEQLMRVHSKAYVEKIFSIAPSLGYVALDQDTIMNAHTLTAALRASGAIVAAVDYVFEGKGNRAFCLVRPPGHHAETNRAMGFCFFNNITVGVAHAFAKYHCERIAIIDFDVHHGNGTEEIFEKNHKVHLWSSFQHPFYPGTILEKKPEHIHLCPLPSGAESFLFQQKITGELIPWLEKVKPQCIFISAGFDGHYLDPLAELSLNAADFAFITKAVSEISQKYASGKIISTLEGGYDLKAIADSAIAHVGAMINY